MYAVFTNIEVFNVWENKTNLELGFPNDEGTLRFTEAVTKVGTDEVIAPINDLIDPTGLTLITNLEAEIWMGLHVEHLTEIPTPPAE